METKELDIEAKADNLEQVITLVDSMLETVDCPLKLQMQIELAVEEIFVNIANYAYAPGTGRVHIRLTLSDPPVTAEIVFIDSGVQYDPLAKEDPDITLSAEQREIGGLGIFLTKKTMDEVSYSYSGGNNILTLRKVIFP